MEKINLGWVIEQAITRVSQNRIGENPPVFVALLPALTRVPWKDTALEQFLHFFLYETILTSDPITPVEISLRRRSLLKDLTAFVGIKPSYWVQLRISGRGLKVSGDHVQDLFAEVGYRCEEWVGTEDAGARLAIFSAINAPRVKIVFCVESMRHRLRCDLLLPLYDPQPVPRLIESAA